jgi:hypothetical protein
LVSVYILAVQRKSNREMRTEISQDVGGDLARKSST